jgi:predicted nucleic acid-binding protein
MVRFWDTSALVSLVAEEPRSAACRRLLKDKAGVVVWALTRTEMTSAVWQRARSGDLTSTNVTRALARIEAMSRTWDEIADLELVRDRAERLLAQHALRAADALQLAAALVLTRDRPRGRDFVTADGALALAAAAEGFRVLIQK